MSRPAKSGAEQAPSASEIEVWLQQGFASKLGVETSEIDPTQPTADFGLGSAALVILSGELQDWLGRDLEPTIFWDYENLRAIALSLGAKT